MNVMSNLATGMSLQHSVDAPCKGVVAKALGKYKLEDAYGATVTFESYQAGPGQPKQPLGDDDAVAPGAILNFTGDVELMLRKQSNHDKIIAWLSEPLLIEIICLFNASLLALSNTMSVTADAGLHQALTAALSALSAEFTAEEVAGALNMVYTRREGMGYSAEPKHANTVAELQRKMEKMRQSGALELLSNEHPVECLIVQNYEVFLRLLQ